MSCLRKCSSQYLARIGFIVIVLLGRYIDAKSEDLSSMSDYIKYLGEKDLVISRNIANVDTPNYHPMDLEEYKTSDPHKDVDIPSLSVTHMLHFSLPQEPKFKSHESKILELKPNNNAVNLEAEMIKKSKNTLDMQEITALYAKIKNMERLSLGSTANSSK